MDLEELIQLLRDAWPTRFERGLITHVHRNHLKLGDGSVIHLRVLVQQTNPPTDLGGSVDLTDF